MRLSRLPPGGPLPPDGHHGRRPGAGSAGVVGVLDEDPDLGVKIAAEERAHAARRAVAPLFELPPGPWRLTAPAEPGSLGLVILEGLIIVRLDTGERAHLELVGAGDLINPWIGPGPDAAVASALTLRVVAPVRLAFLDRSFTARTAQWPEIHAALVERLVIRSRRLSLQAAINALARTEERLELTFWGLAFRFGRVTGNGYALSLPLSHARLAEMVAATRPSVSGALSRLHRAGRLVRTATPGEWLLTGSPPDSLSRLADRITLPS